MTTTGTQNPVVFDDLGKRSYSHPTTNYNLLSDFSSEELSNSSSLFTAITNGYITLKDDFNTTITTSSQIKSLLNVSFTKNAIGLSNVTNDAQIPKSIGITKGDLITFTGTESPVRLPSGTNGQVLSSDNTQSSGLIWTDIIFGSWRQYAEVITEASTTGTTFITRVTITTPIIPAGDYLIGWYAETRVSNANRFGDISVAVNGTQVAINTQYISSADVNISVPASGQKKVTLTNASHTITLRFRMNPNSGGSTFFIKNASLYLFRWS